VKVHIPHQGLHVAKHKVAPGTGDFLLAGDTAFDKNFVGSTADRTISFNFPHGTSPPPGDYGSLGRLGSRLGAIADNAENRPLP
jgi:hypothetical protein